MEPTPESGPSCYGATTNSMVALHATAITALLGNRMNRPHNGVTAAGLSGTQRGGEHLAISAPDLSLQPGVQELHRHSRCLSGGLAKAPRRDRPNRLHRNPRFGNHRSINMKAGITGERERRPPLA